MLIGQILYRGLSFACRTRRGQTNVSSHLVNTCRQAFHFRESERESERERESQRERVNADEGIQWSSAWKTARKLVYRARFSGGSQRVSKGFLCILT